MGTVLQMRPGKTETPCNSRCGTIKIDPLCSKALSAEHRTNFCSPSPAMVTFPYLKEKKLSRTYNSKKSNHNQFNVDSENSYEFLVFDITKLFFNSLHKLA
jgi:hypothetical protein